MNLQVGRESDGAKYEPPEDWVEAVKRRMHACGVFSIVFKEQNREQALDMLSQQICQLLILMEEPTNKQNKEEMRWQAKHT